jgi:hypothetical protein
VTRVDILSKIVKAHSQIGDVFKKIIFVTVLRKQHCEVFDWRPSLLGNRSRNGSMDTLTTPVLLRCMVTNSGKVSVSIVAGSVKEGKTIHRVSLRQSASEVSLRQSVSVISARIQSSSVSRRSETSVQCSFDSSILEAMSAKVFTIIVICVVALNLHSE